MKCKICGKNADSEYCFQHKPRKPLKKHRNIIIHTGATGIELVDETFEIDFMRQLFLTIWKKRKHISEVSGQFLGNEPLTIYFHHILPKEKYPEFRFNEKNIILLSFEEHQNVENDMYKYDEINKRRDLLKKLFNL